MDSSIIQSIYHTVNVMVHRIARFHFHLCQIGAEGECAFTNGGNTGRNGCFRQAAALERKTTNGTQAGRQVNILQQPARNKGTFADGMQHCIVRKANTDQRVTLESTFSNFQNGSRNVDFRNIATREC